MYNINILSDVQDENIRVAIIAAVNEMMTVESEFHVARMKRGKIEAPIWNAVSRQNFEI